MSIPKQKSENYQNIGGINTKGSRYITGPHQCLDLQNFDFSRVASLTRRQGTTFTIGATLPARIGTLYEYTRLTGASYQFAVGASEIYKWTGSGFQSFYSLGATSGMGFIGQSVYVSDRLSMKTFSDYLWMSNNWTFLQTQGTSVYLAQLPPLNTSTSAVTSATGVGASYFFATHTYVYRAAYLNHRGYVGPAGSTLVFGVSSTGGAFPISSGATQLAFNLSADPTGYDAFQTLVWRVDVGYGTSCFCFVTGTTFLNNSGNKKTFVDNGGNGTIPSGMSLCPDPGINDDNVTFLNYQNGSNTVQIGTPSILELYNNSMFYAGFDFGITSFVVTGFFSPFTIDDPHSTVFFSESGNPELILQESFFEVRTNDGDKITCLRSYDGQIIISKRFSFHIVYGDDPDNYTLTEKSDQYGILNKRCSAVWHSKFWFLDGAGKGIVEYNGSNFQVKSDAIEAVFKRMNLSAALLEAEMMHVKERNEVWTLIPIDSSSTNNCVVVYDYIADAWTTFFGIEAATMVNMFYTFDTPKPVFGGYSGMIRHMGATLFSDYGNPIRTVYRPRFVSNYGWSATELYRRLFLDVDPILGITYTFGLNMYVNQSDTPAQSQTFTSATFQQRIDFGIPGKGFSPELINSDLSPLRINGFTIESRFQRAT